MHQKLEFLLVVSWLKVAWPWHCLTLALNALTLAKITRPPIELYTDHTRWNCLTLAFNASTLIKSQGHPWYINIATPNCESGLSCQVLVYNVIEVFLENSENESKLKDYGIAVSVTCYYWLVCQQGQVQQLTKWPSTTSWLLLTSSTHLPLRQLSHGMSWPSSHTGDWQARDQGDNVLVSTPVHGSSKSQHILTSEWDVVATIWTLLSFIFTPTDFVLVGQI